MDLPPLTHLFVVVGAAQGEIEIFQNVHAAQQDEGSIVGEGDVAELDLTRCHPFLSRIGGAYRLCFAGL